MSAKEKLTAAKACRRAFAKTSPDLFEGFMLVSTTTKCCGTYSIAKKNWLHRLLLWQRDATIAFFITLMQHAAIGLMKPL